MKHKILLATNPSPDFDNLIKDLLNLLNTTHEKYVTAFSPKNYESSQLVAVNSGFSNSTTDLDHFVEDVEIEALLQQKAEEYDVNFQWLGDPLDEERLTSLSTVFDLMILEENSFEGCSISVVDELLSVVKCPILLLPRDWEIENLVVFHDGSMDSVKMIKDFINLFNPDLRNLPLSLLISHSDKDYDVDAEKVFVDYLKMFFKDIGVQLIQGNFLDNLNQSIVYNSNKPFLMFGVKGKTISAERIIDSPTFLFKG